MLSSLPDELLWYILEKAKSIRTVNVLVLRSSTSLGLDIWLCICVLQRTGQPVHCGEVCSPSKCFRCTDAEIHPLHQATPSVQTWTYSKSISNHDPVDSPHGSSLVEWWPSHPSPAKLDQPTKTQLLDPCWPLCACAVAPPYVLGRLSNFSSSWAHWTRRVPVASTPKFDRNVWWLRKAEHFSVREFTEYLQGARLWNSDGILRQNFHVDESHKAQLLLSPPQNWRLRHPPKKFAFHLDWS